ncbi:hypothetical protein DPMN_047733 [Dreissena polymorpha]|uniref:Uncharacterized protein n=1 Tax=Dreissena polymorpha TaxID=45954 RepID=A0A9D4D9D4_DREPO|nr:hypothetical protein DPMN_047733 [Dreissena polymorpha]
MGVISNNIQDRSDKLDKRTGAHSMEVITEKSTIMGHSTNTTRASRHHHERRESEKK